MKGLLIKDYKLMKNQAKYYLVIVLIAGIVPMLNFSGKEDFSMFVCAYLTFLFAYFTLSTINYDEFDNGLEYLMTLPASRKIYVQEKYLFCLINTTLAWLFISLLNLFCGLERNLSLLLLQVPVLIGILIFVFISLVFFLKFGQEKGRIVAMFVLGGACGIFLCIIKACPELEKDIEEMLSHLTAGGSMPQLGMVAAVLLILMIVPYLISVKIMEKREF